MAASAALVTVFKKQLTIFITTVLFLCYFHCHNVLAGASHVTAERYTLQVDSHHTWRNSKAGAAHDQEAGFAATGESSPESRTSGDGSLTRRKVTSHDGGDTNSLALEVKALVAFKAAITSDPLGALKSWRANDSDTCGWAGVVCSPQHPKHLIALNLGGGKLVGNLNSALQELGNLPFLQRLDLSINVFTGTIPAASLANCSSLSYLNFSQNHLSGEIPSDIGELVNLQSLDIGENNLTGEIPVSLGNCTMLRVLHLGFNSLEGDIPPALGRLSHLEFLSLRSNSLAGAIPSAFGNYSSITYLSLDCNLNLGGELPPELSRLVSVQYLSLSSCNFQGALPAWLGNLTALSLFYLAYNQFFGVIPEEIGRLGHLREFSVGKNNLTGAIPTSITNCTGLIFLHLPYNQLTGHIPPQLGLLRSLELLSLHTNSFGGVVPSSIANCSALTDLELGFNPLLDPQVIPSWIGSFTDLSTLLLTEMNLKGNIPEEIGKLSNLQGLYLAINSLTGAIPSLANCSLLTYLELSYNQLTGDVPRELGQLLNLVELNLVDNSLTGAFPAFSSNLTQIELLAVGDNHLTGEIDCNFGRLSQLQEFYADLNSFSGPIPETLSNCSQLSLIELAYNSLDGEIPPSLGNLTELQQLSLGVNKITGSIPVDLIRCSNLGYLYLEDTNLEGNVPSNIGQLSFLQYLYLDHNSFSGTVPTSLGNCSSMLELYLDYNQLTGNVPWDIILKMSSSLTALDLSHNLFSGSLPPQVSQLTLIQILDVSSNKISGSIPQSLGSCNTLLKLDVSLNNLTGGIPQSLGLLPQLYFFNASYNNLDGPIPASGLFQTNITTASFLGNPGLCGDILGANRECPAPSAQHNETSKTACKGFNCKGVWIPTTIAMIVGVLLIVAGVVLFWVNSGFRFYGIQKRNSKSYHVMFNFEAYTRISERDVLRAIGRDGENVIGVGGKSVVYKGVLPGGEMFAVKILSQHGDNDEGVEDSKRKSKLLKEVHTLAKLRHRNIIKLLSFCSTLDVTAMIMEYMPEGSLYKHVHEQPEEHKCDLTWQKRFNIAVGVAEAMVYLHHDFPEPLIHADLKPSNVLLDTDLEPKVGDFGISKFCNPNSDGEATQSTVRGTLGYMPPEYGTGTKVSTKGDVYSYGVVLLEMLTRRPPILMNSEESNSGNYGDLRHWVMESFHETPLELLDSTLQHEGSLNSIKSEQMLLLMRVALFCTRENPQSRPSMSDVLAMLTQIKEAGLAPVARRTLQDLAKDENAVWTNQDPSNVNLPSF